ncbi:uncharacterized protein LOC127748534 [Arachis duranensis]|uniref:Uncharacterized protein LOC127748534 n=1 Tax=Arachis duranensis TaxID=130453 RepID=A0A9C6TM84_ARADU|nr:uncharacterized protein LOC127748534 [Arachis duranensis]
MDEQHHKKIFVVLHQVVVMVVLVGPSSCVKGGEEEDRILELPGQPKVSFQQFSGYVTVNKNRSVGPNRNPYTKTEAPSFLSPVPFPVSPLSFFHSERNQITQPQAKNPSTVSLHHRRKEWHTAAPVALKVCHSSVYLASFVIQVFNPCSLSPIAAASSSSASVVFVCSAALPSPFVCRSRSHLRSAVVFVRVLRRSRSLGVYCSRSLAVHRSSLHSCSSGSHVALLQTLRPTRTLHLAVELLSFVAAVNSLNPPLDNTLTQHQYSASNSATSDFYYNKLTVALPLVTTATCASCFPSLLLGFSAITLRKRDRSIGSSVAGEKKKKSERREGRLEAQAKAALVTMRTNKISGDWATMEYKQNQ